MRSFTTLLIGLQVLVAGGCVVASAAELDGVITPVEKWSCLFGGQEVTLSFRVSSQKDGSAVEAGRLRWRYAADQRTLARGETEWDPEDQGVAALTLSVPAVRAGLVFPTELSVSCVTQESSFESSTLTRTLWLFAEDPFVHQREVMKEQNLFLFDPDGRTADLFRDAELPVQQIHSIAVLEARPHDSCLIVGEDTSLIRNRRLAEQLLSFAAAGGTVLMLAPSEGVIPMPDETSQVQPGEFRLRRNHVISDFDKRLDSISWPGTSGLPGSRITLRTRFNRIGMEVSKDGDWPWMTIEYPETRGRFVFCGFSAIQHWRHGPTPRYLLHRILKTYLDR